MRLVYSVNGIEVKVGDTIEHPDDQETLTVLSITKPHKPSSTGRVYVQSSKGYKQEYYPNVIDAEWIEREDL